MHDLKFKSPICSILATDGLDGAEIEWAFSFSISSVQKKVDFY
jgi:hypothetical protein